MADEATQTGTVGTEQNPASQQGAPATGNEPVSNQQQTQQNDNDGGRSIDGLPKWAQEHIRETRQEAAKYRTQLREAEEAKRKEQLPETEREKEEAVAAALADANEKFNERFKRSEALRALTAAKIVNPERTLRLLELENVTVEDDGTIKGLDREIETLKTDYPNLVQGANTNAEVHTEGKPTGKETNMNDVLRRMAGRA